MWRSAVQLCAGLPKDKRFPEIFNFREERKQRAPKWRRSRQSVRGFAEREGGLAQLARAPALQAGGQRFESVILHVALLKSI